MKKIEIFFCVTAIILVYASLISIHKTTTHQNEICVLEKNGVVVEYYSNSVIKAGDCLEPGFILGTSSNSSALLKAGDGLIAMYEDTSLRFFKFTNSEFDVAINTGRIAVNWNNPGIDSYVFRAGEVKLTSGRMFSIVNYSFANKISLIPFENTSIDYMIDDQISSTNQPLEVEFENESLNIKNATFTLSGNAAEDFYKWFFNQAEIAD